MISRRPCSWRRRKADTRSLSIFRNSASSRVSREHQSESDGHGRGRAFGSQFLEPLQQREIRVERGLAQPVAAVRPAAVVQDVRQVTVEPEDELHRVPGQLERAADRTASARTYRAKYCSPERCQPNCWAIAPRTSLRHAFRSAYASTARRTAWSSAAGEYSSNRNPLTPSIML